LLKSSKRGDFNMSEVVKKKEKMEFSKKLLVQESALIWLITIAFIILAFVCIIN